MHSDQLENTVSASLFQSLLQAIQIADLFLTLLQRNLQALYILATWQVKKNNSIFEPGNMKNDHTCIHVF